MDTFNWLKGGVFFFSSSFVSSSGEGGFYSSKICLVFAQGSCKYVIFFFLFLLDTIGIIV